MRRTHQPTVAAATLGCRLNQYETEQLIGELLGAGFVRVEPTEQPDLYLINTCTVTHRADSDSRQLVRRFRSLAPSAGLVVAGCYVDSDREAIESIDHSILALGNSEKRELLSRVQAAFPHLFASVERTGCDPAIPDFSGQHRAWLKVSDGCNQWCSFCIIPQVRGRLKNRSPLSLLSEVQGLAAKGFREVVLTGINVGHYSWRSGEPQLKNLAALCRFLAAESDIDRIRISSIEPQSVRDDLIDWFGQAESRLCRHWHLPLQSGSDRILRLMQRPYNARTYMEKLRALKSARPNTIIGGDVIVGFPGEEKDDFARTMELADSGLLDYLHVFSYSDRRSTRASGMQDKVSPSIIKERNALLSRASERMRARALARQQGEVLRVIAEDASPGRSYQLGVADNYLKVGMPPNRCWGRELVSMKIESVNGDHLTGRIADDPAEASGPRLEISRPSFL